MNLKKSTPFEYQKQTIEKGVKLLKVFGHLALAPVFMGAGKTLMSMYMSIDLEHETIIIICPKTLISNWKSEIEKHTTFSNILEWDCQKSKTIKYINQFRFWNSKIPKIFILNIEAFQNSNKQLSKLLYAIQNKNQKTFVILDESSKVKCIDAARTKRIIETLPPAWNRVILTGTPITNSPLDFFAQYEFLKSNFWGIQANSLKNAFYRFRYRYAVLVDERVNRDRVIKKVIGFKKLDDLKSRIDYCTISLKKEDCVDLPEKIEQVVPLEMSDEQRAFYDTFVKKLLAELNDSTLSVTSAIAKFTRVRQICGGFFKEDENGTIQRILPNQKIDFLLDDIEDTDEKIIIATSFHEEVSILYDFLTTEYGKESTVCYTGLQSIEARENNLQAFKNNKDTRFLLLNPATGAFGLNLQFCHIMYFYSLPVSPEQFWQLKERIHRIGQKDFCIYKYALYKNSIDERIKFLLDRKEELTRIFTSKEVIKQFLIGDLK